MSHLIHIAKNVKVIWKAIRLSSLPSMDSEYLYKLELGLMYILTLFVLIVILILT